MATDVERLAISIEASTRAYTAAMKRVERDTNNAFKGGASNVIRLNRGMDQATVSAGRLHAAMAKTTSAVGALTKGFVGGLVASATISNVLRLVKSVAELADEAKRAGTSAEDLQAIGFAAQQAGSNTEEMVDLLKKFNIEIGEAGAKGNDLSKLLAANGIPLRNMNGELRNTKALFFDVVDLIAGAKTQQEAALIAMIAFGKAAGDALPFLRQGSAALREGMQAARDTGAVISEELVRKADEFDDRWNASWAVFSAQGKSAILEVLIFLDKLGDAVEKFDKGMRADTARKFGPFAESDELKARAEEVQRQIKALEDAAKNGMPNAVQMGLPALAALRAELAAINAELAQMGPAFERAGRGVAKMALPGVSRNPFDTGYSRQVTTAGLGGDSASASKVEVEFPDAAVKKFVDQVVKAESGGNANARNPNSSATGLGQFIESTWLSLFRREFPDRAKGMADATILALRTDADISRQMIEVYARDNADILRKAGVSVDAAALHLAHFLGAGDAAKVLNAPRGTPLAGLISSRAISANPTILGGGRTVDDARLYAMNRANQARVGSGDFTEAEKKATEARAEAQQKIKELRDAFADLLASSDESTRSMLQQAAAVGKSAREQAYLAEFMRLTNEAARDGNDLTEKQIELLKARANAFADASAAEELARENAAQTQQQFEDAQRQIDEIRDIGREAFLGLADALKDGKVTGDELLGILSKIADKLIDMAANSLADNLFGAQGSSGGGIFGSLLGNLFGASAPAAPATFARGGIARRASVFGEAGPEAAVPLPDGRSIPVTIRMPKLVSSAGRSGAPNIRTGDINLQVGEMTDANLARTRAMIAEAQSRQKRDLQREFGGVGNRYASLRG